MYISRELITEEKNYCRMLIEKYEREQILLPQGSLTKKKIKGRDYYYHQISCTVQGRPKLDSNGKTDFARKRQVVSRYLSKNDTSIISGIKRRRFIQKSIPHLKKNLKILEKLLKEYRPYEPQETLDRMPEIYSGFPVREGVKEDFNINMEWSALKEYENNFHPENLRHITASGRPVRSKSEAIIADLLDTHKLTYKYEVEICLSNRKVFPDFAILRKSDNHIIYWEHFGLMGNEEYAQGMIDRINDYQVNGILLWDNLIFSADSLEGCIDARKISNMIKAVLLI